MTVSSLYKNSAYTSIFDYAEVNLSCKNPCFSQWISAWHAVTCWLFFQLFCI